MPEIHVQFCPGAVRFEYADVFWGSWVHPASVTPQAIATAVLAALPATDREAVIREACAAAGFGLLRVRHIGPLQPLDRLGLDDLESEGVATDDA